MIKIKNFLLFLFALKFSLDFLSPYRELNFAIFNLTCILFLLVKPVALENITKREWGYCCIYFILCSIWLPIGGAFSYYIKFLSLILVFLVIKSGASKLTAEELSKIANNAFYLFVALAFVNFAISFFVASPLSRDFYNFEHANLLGSYLLLSLSFIYTSSLSKSNQIQKKLLVSAMALASTSTGSFISSLLTLKNFRKTSAREIFGGALIFISILYSSYFILSHYSPDSFTKIFGPIQLLINGGASELAYAAENRLPIQTLGDDYQSSLLWRLYAYIVFIGYIHDEPILQLIFGNGFWGFSKIWNGFAPHNDFLLTLIDFGLIGFCFFIFFISKILAWTLKHEITLLPLILILSARLLFENNIYSYYILSGLVMNSAFLYLARNKIRGAK
jgi:hypothetical protein